MITLFYTEVCIKYVRFITFGLSEMINLVNILQR